MKQTAINLMLQRIINERPGLAGLQTEKPIVDYLKPALEWQQNSVFPQTQLLSNLLTDHIARLYPKTERKEVENHLQKSWVIETGAHLHIPRRYNNVNRTDGPQINSLLFQGQVLWAMSQQKLGRKMSLSLNSGRVPLDNTNSGAYLDLPALKIPLTLASKKRHPDSPQSLIPARSKQDMQDKIELLNMYYKQKTLPENQYQLGLEILENFVSVQSSFSDQVATSHAHMLNKVLPIMQITLDSEFVGNEFLLALLKDKTSFTYSLFQDPKKREIFLNYLSDIRTGWPKGGSPFYFVAKKGEGYRLTQYQGELSPNVLIKGLEENTLWPTGAMKFFVFMVEGGLLPIGGWTQAGYCTQIKTQSVKLLRELNFHDQAEVLSHMPTDIAAVGPCWAIHEADGRLQLLDALTPILDQTLIDAAKLMKLTAYQTFLIAAPTLYEFLTGNHPDVSYDSLSEVISFARLEN